MVCKTTSTNRRAQGSRAAFTLMEMLFASLITGMVVFTLIGMSISSGHHFAAYANYVELNDANRLAMDTITRDLRECNRVISSGTNFLYIEAGDGQPLLYSHIASTKTVRRWKAGVSKVILNGCESMRFTLLQRNPKDESYDVYPAATPATAKVVDVAWNCSRSILGVKANTENVQTARIVIRRQGT